MIILSDVCKSFANKEVIDNISAEIDNGEFVVITGKSGCGKTTLLNIVGLLDTPDSGVVSIDGKTYFSHKEKMMFYRNDLGFLFQNFALIENESVQNNLKIGIAYKSLSKTEQRKKFQEVLEQVGLPNYENKKVYQLSGGEQQRIALARLILKKPQYICADEPTGNLDDENRDLVFSILKKLNAKGCTVIVVTHDTTITNMGCISQLIEL